MGWEIDTDAWVNYTMRTLGWGDRAFILPTSTGCNVMHSISHWGMFVTKESIDDCEYEEPKVDNYNDHSPEAYAMITN